MSTNRRTTRPYPRRCHACREVAVRPHQERRTVEAKYDGTVYEVTVPDFPVNRCSRCGATTIGPEADDATNRALRDHVGLLHPHEIRASREALDLTQRQLAELLGCAPETVCRWEKEAAIQALSFDRVLRAFFHLRALRDFFEALQADHGLGRTVASAPEDDRYPQRARSSELSRPPDAAILTEWPVDAPLRRYVLLDLQPRTRTATRYRLPWELQRSPDVKPLSERPQPAIGYLRDHAWTPPDE